jgi:A/G-specific adenine glycosylase
MTGAVTQSQEHLASLLATTKIKWFRRQLTHWAALNLREFPWRSTTDPYAIFIAEFLLQKTGANTVVPIYETFLTRYPTLKDLATASVTEIAILLKPLGLHFRTDRLYQSVRVIVEQYDRKIPTTEAQLLALPGIGLYTARSICAHAFAQPLAILDTNVARILERFFGLQGNRVKSRCKLLWGAAEYVAPKTNVSQWNLTLLDFGAGVCTARNPSCGICPLRSQCNYAEIHFDRDRG